MNVFTDILTNITNNNTTNFLFITHFTSISLSYKKITYSEFTNYKYFILKNFLFSSTISDSV